MSPSWSHVRRMLCNKCAALGIPVSGVFELTPRCNLRCKMCYVRLTPEQMTPLGQERTAQQWVELGRQAFFEKARLYYRCAGRVDEQLQMDFFLRNNTCYYTLLQQTET